MRVLVVVKTTNLDLHGEIVRRRIAEGVLHEGHLQVLESVHREHLQTLEYLAEALIASGLEFDTVARGQFWPDLSGYGVVVTVGGDGTLLEASHHIPGAELKLVGIRSSKSSVGHLCFGGFDDIDDIVAGIRADRLPFAKVGRLVGLVERASGGEPIQSLPVLNDFLYANSNPAATSQYVLRYGSLSESQKSSGIWIATPAGSTAAIAAAGGTKFPIFGVNCQFLVRELYSPDCQLAGSEFSPEGVDYEASRSLEIENMCRHAILATDGQHGHIDLGFGDKVRFSRSAPINLAVQNRLDRQ